MIYFYSNITTGRTGAREVSVIYLNGQTGRDDQDGLTEATAVKTFAKAKEIATNTQSIQEIVITDKVELSGSVSLEGTNAKLRRADDCIDYMIVVPQGETLELSNITIGGNEIEKIKKSM